MEITKKISLILLGIFLSLIILETGLQIAGFALTTIKKYKNKTTKDPNTITILCLGESTTDNQWPPILQKILDKRSKNKKFNVIDEGHAGKNSEYLFYEIIEKKLTTYNPDIVISMMGTNDALSNKPYIMKTSNWYYNLKIYKLIVLINDHLSKKIKYSELNNAEINVDIPKNVISFIEEKARSNKSNITDLILLKSIIQKYPKIYWHNHMLPALVKQYFNEIILKEKLNCFNLEDFLKYYYEDLDIKFVPFDIIYAMFAKEFFEIKDYNNAVKCAKTALQYSNRSYNLIKDILPFDNNEIEPFQIKHKLYIDDGYNITLIIYNYTIKYIFNNNQNTKYIVMQYPTLSIKQLKQDLRNSCPYYDKLIFISNEENFKQALKNCKTENIFTDMFGGSFGHCTELGNTLIAENVAETILKLYN